MSKVLLTRQAFNSSSSYRIRPSNTYTPTTLINFKPPGMMIKAEFRAVLLFAFAIPLAMASYGPPAIRARPPPTRASSSAVPTQTYSSCGGFRATPLNCAEGELCIDDPYAGGCGMACDAPGICVKPISCGEKDACDNGKKCVTVPYQGCDGGDDVEGCLKLCV
jgi:hypothetical protein